MATGPLKVVALKLGGAVLLAALSFGAGARLWPNEPITVPLMGTTIGQPAWQQALYAVRGTAEADAMRGSALDAIAEAPSEAVRADAVDLLGFVGDEADVGVAGLLALGLHPDDGRAGAGLRHGRQIHVVHEDVVDPRQTLYGGWPDSTALTWLEHSTREITGDIGSQRLRVFVRDR